jgi:hypothetical protein
MIPFVFLPWFYYQKNDKQRSAFAVSLLLFKDDFLSSNHSEQLQQSCSMMKLAGGLE